jgi:uncharacterized membrane protein YgcG
MKTMRALAALLAALLLALPAGARAEERIKSYVADIQVRADGAVDVVETITVNAEGNRIQRGIYRDFPTRYDDRLGRRVRVGFEVESVERNGAPERYALETLSNGVRVRIGNPDVLLPYQDHQYRIRYRTTRQVGFFDGYDEIYWNVTGNGWIFPIDTAEARITLPEAVPFTQRDFYTGSQGSKGKNAEVVSEEPGRIVFRTTAPLGSEEGLTVAAAFPKGVVTPPSSSQQTSWWLADNGPFALAGLGLIGLLFYYFHAWRRAGRGPRAGTIVPIFSPPDGLSPAGARYISEMGSDNRTFAAAIVDLGVKGRVRLVEGEKGWFTKAKTTIERTGEADGLPDPEAAMHARLFASGDSVLMDNKYHATFTAARTALSSGLSSAYEGKLFKRNHDWSLFGLLLLAAAMWLPAALIVATEPSGGENRWALPLLGLVLLAMSIALFRMDVQGTALRWAAKAFAIFLAIGAVLFAGSTIVVAFDSGRVLPILIPLLSLPFVISAFWWMAAPTKEGRAVMDRIAGFKRYLSITEEERLATMHPPEKTPELFERYLPYAIALDVENEWAGRFATVLAAAAAAGQAHHMLWYSGHSDPWNDPGSFADQVGSTLASTVSSAATAPGSSSGSGGGGSSGGGGGGGGGGGW